METLPTEHSTVDWGNDAIDAAHLEKAFLSLTEGARAVFVLIEVEGYTHREVAELLQKFRNRIITRLPAKIIQKWLC